MKNCPNPLCQAAGEFSERFEEISEPALKAFYRALSPDFWAWLDKK